MLRGLKHAPAIWLQKYTGSHFLRFLSSRPGETSTARIVSFCCCNSGRHSFLRRLRTYASGGYFMRPYISMWFWSHLGSPGASLWSSLGALQAFPGVVGPLFAAQAAQIRGCCLFHIVIINNKEFIFSAQAAWISALWRSWALRRHLIAAQAAQIRVQRIFHSIVHI